MTTPVTQEVLSLLRERRCPIGGGALNPFPPKFDPSTPLSDQHLDGIYLKTFLDIAKHDPEPDQ